MKQHSMNLFSDLTKASSAKRGTQCPPAAFPVRTASAFLGKYKAQRFYSVSPKEAWLRFGMVAVATSLFVFVQAVPLRAQEHKSKVPLLGKITSSSTRHQAYSGTVQSLDMKQKILNVYSRQGRNIEIFPLKKDVRVKGADGKKMKLKALRPGMTVLIYYDEKRGERTVKNIIVLKSVKDRGEPKHTSAS